MKQQQGELLKFIQNKEYEFQRYIGRGGTGQTVLIKDNLTEYFFVCKKYSPVQEEYKDEFFTRFIEEIKIMYPLYHQNIVRIFNYFLYPSQKTGYILMEHIQGSSIDEYLAWADNKDFENIFIQLLEGFSYLESKKILHRDIRFNNIMVTDEGILKIIDFGFGKKIVENNDKASILLNWPVTEYPSEISEHIYNHRTEVYFVGKLFKKLLDENVIKNFKYTKLLSKMLKIDPIDRIESFENALQCISNDRFIESSFDEPDKIIYQNFADAINDIISSNTNSMDFKEDRNSIINSLRDVVENSLLENYIQNNCDIIECFISNNFRYSTYKKVHSKIVKDFYLFLIRIDEQQQTTVFNNLKSRFKSIPVYYDDDIPF